MGMKAIKYKNGSVYHVGSLIGHGTVVYDSNNQTEAFSENYVRLFIFQSCKMD